MSFLHHKMLRAASRGPLDISLLSYDGISYSVNSEEIDPYSVNFNNDGTRMFVVGWGADTIFTYQLGAPYQIVQGVEFPSLIRSSGVGDETGTPICITFDESGSNVYIVGSLDAAIYQYSLSTAFDTNTRSVGPINTLSVSAQESQPSSMRFNDNGSKMYLMGYDSDTIYQYSLSVPYDISAGSVSYDSVFYSVGYIDLLPTDFIFLEGGLKMLVLGRSADIIRQLELTTAYDLATVTDSGLTANIQAQSSNVSGFIANASESKLYVTDLNNIIYQYSMR